jgi:hypothetical protein
MSSSNRTGQSFRRSLETVVRGLRRSAAAGGTNVRTHADTNVVRVANVGGHGMSRSARAEQSTSITPRRRNRG